MTMVFLTNFHFDDITHTSITILYLFTELNLKKTREKLKN